MTPSWSGYWSLSDAKPREIQDYGWALPSSIVSQGTPRHSPGAMTLPRFPFAMLRALAHRNDTPFCRCEAYSPHVIARCVATKQSRSVWCVKPRGCRASLPITESENDYLNAFPLLR